MSKLKTKQVIATGLSALMMMFSVTSVFAAESDSKSNTLNYEVSSRYDWMIHSTIDFGEDAGTNKTIDRTGNGVKVLKNVIPEGKYLNISVKGSGASDAFTVSNGGSEVLNYDVSDDNGAVCVNGNVLSVPAGTNTATQNMGFKLNTTKKSAEVAGQYNGRVIYNAGVGDKNGGTISGGSTSGGTTEGGSSGGTVMTPSELKTLDIEGTKYVVLEERENNQALVMTTSNIGSREFQITLGPYGEPIARHDGKNNSTYENSTIDNYLENEWYNSLSSKMKVAIQPANIKQVSYTTYNDPNAKQETGPNGQVYNTIRRHVFLPSVSELVKVVDLKNPDKVKAFLNGASIQTRDSYQCDTDHTMILSAYDNNINTNITGSPEDVRPAFVVDLSQVNYSVVK
ncbi:hypothetical protein DW744_08925 [Eubacterium sp. AM28-29]|nr:hypothetical protein DW744_08925 [Eubacterium sp. AM28-29]